MCGIVGFTTTPGRRPAGAQRAVLGAMMDAIRHRGPDGDGVHLAPLAGAAGPALALGHLRLAILDLGTGDQPMRSADGRRVIVFNGEIYNYVELREELRAVGQVFRTSSDTEVLLAAWDQWGPDCFARLRGMYAFAIHEPATGRLILGRDPFGKKPLLWFRDGDDLVFASEFAGLAAHPAFCARIDPQGLAHYMRMKYVPGPATLIAGVTQLPPGHWAEFDGTRLTVRRHYGLPVQAGTPGGPAALPWTEGTVRAFAGALTDAVRIRLRSDVPLGAFLSGGIDSSAVVAIMARETGRPVRTFSIGFTEAEYSELWAARLVAGRFGTDHHELTISPDLFLDKFEEVTWQRGAPLSEMADVPLYYLSKLAAGHVKVVLSGEGSDELLAGYPKHWGDFLAERYQRLVPAVLDPLLLDVPHRLLPYRFRRAAILLRAARERDFLARQQAWFGLMTAGDAAALCPGLFAGCRPFVWEEDPGPQVGPVARALAFDKTVWLPGTLLERGDRMTMAASIEGRMPFMDKDLAAFVATLPPQAFLDGRSGKTVLRRAMAGILPDEILTRPKVGFRVPVHEWLRGRLRGFARDLLTGADSRVGAFCDRSRMETLLGQHERAEVNREKELWALLALEVFLRQLDRHTARTPVDLLPV